MKLWQTRFDIISRETIDIKTMHYKTTWDNVTAPLVCDDEFCDFFPKTSENGKCVIFGDVSSTYVGINCTDEHIRDVFFCVDARNIDFDEIEVICDFINDNNSYIVKNNVIYKADADILKQLVQASEGYRFVQNPIKYLLRFTDK